MSSDFFFYSGAPVSRSSLSKVSKMSGCKNNTNTGIGTPAPHPWDSIHADTVLRTTDLVNFRVHIDLLALISTTFKAKLPPDASFTSLNHCSNCPCQSHLRDRPPVIHVVENSHILNILLRHVYPVGAPEVLSIAEVFATLKASRAYGMTAISKQLYDKLVHLAQDHPFQVFAEAAKFQWLDEMQIAATASLSHSIHDVYYPDMEGLSAGTYFRLLEYNRKCTEAALSAVTDVGWFLRVRKSPPDSTPPIWLRCTSCTLVAAACDGAPSIRVVKWFHEYLGAIKKSIESFPCGSAMRDPGIAYPYLTDAASCHECRISAFADIKVFNDLLSGEIQRAIAEVSLIQNKVDDFKLRLSIL